MKILTMQLETLTCPSCAIKIEKALKNLNGITLDSITVLFNASKVKLAFDDSVTNATTIEKAITTLGYQVLKTQIKSL
ncbi:MAG: heavy metal-associated domain-containing protein [Erysipelotrichaceae bacterium]|nr:heavy metal-associated domain-containing protein [Erysipelotrichaceae bacterium]